MKPVSRLVSLSLASLLAMIVLGEAFAPLPAAAESADPAADKSPSAQIQVTVDAVGNAQVEATVANVDKLVSPGASSSAVAANLSHALGLDHTFFDLENLTSVSNPQISGFTVDCQLTGLAQPTNEQSQWKVPLSVEMANPSAKVTDNQIAITTGDSAATVQSLTITLPTGSTNISLSDDGRYVAFTMPAPQLPAGTDCSVHFNVDSQPQIMSCMSKSYGSDKLPTLWVARATFTNTGATALKEYWVRYRVKDYTADWTDWIHYAGPILPSETIVSPYYPTFDLDKMKTIQGTRTAELDVEYAYENPKGQDVRKTVARGLDILDPNDVPVSTDQMEYVMPSFVTKDDPIIRQIAAIVIAQMPEGMNVGTNNGAKEFMNQLFRFMKSNGIRYQLPAKDVNLDRLIQHVKYGRDVIVDKAGTCIDLAIFYASVCEAAGLEPVMYLPKKDLDGNPEGHCFPGIHMPGKDEAGNNIDAPILAVETTLIGHSEMVFDDAVAVGSAEQQDIVAKSTGPVVDIGDMRVQGVHSMELRDLQPETLRNLGIAAASAPRSITGCWDTTFTDKNGKPVNVETEFLDDGSAKFAVEPGDGSAVDFQTGTAKYDGSAFHFNAGKFDAWATVTWLDNDHFDCKWKTCDSKLVEGLALQVHRVPGRDLNLFACVLNIPAPQVLPPVGLPQLPTSQVNAVAQNELDPAAPNTGKVIDYDLEVLNAINTPCVAELTFTDAQGHPILSWSWKAIAMTKSLTPPYANTRYAHVTYSLKFSDIDWLMYPGQLQVFYKLQVRRVSDGAVIGGDTEAHSFTAS